MDRAKCAFAIYAKGEHLSAYKENLVAGLKAHVPGVDVVELDPVEAEPLINGLSDADKPYFVRMAIPLMSSLEKYDRVVWVDVDTDVVSDEFASIFDVETSDDGLAAARDWMSPEEAYNNLHIFYPEYDNRELYVNSGVIVFDLPKIDRNKWEKKAKEGIRRWMGKRSRLHDQDVFNLVFRFKEIGQCFNQCSTWHTPSDGAFLVHYGGDEVAKAPLNALLVKRGFMCTNEPWRYRCVVVAPRHSFIRPWIRAYFASGNSIPLVIVPGPPGDWKPGDMEYCRAAAESTGGCILDCSSEWESSKRLATRAAQPHGGPIVGWYSKKSILHAVATRLSPKIWAWIDDDAEVTGNLGECFTAAEIAPGFVFAQYYYPQPDLTKDYSRSRHPVKMLTWKVSGGEKLCWNSLVVFHGDANERLKDLDRDFPVEDDEIIFGDLYKNNDKWHEGFCDFSLHNWQAICRIISNIPANWKGKLLHYTGAERHSEIKKYWAAKADRIRAAPFEKDLPRSVTHPGSPSYAAPRSTGPKYNPLVTAKRYGTAIHLRTKPITSRSVTASDSERIALHDKALAVLRRRAK